MNEAPLVSVVTTTFRPGGLDIVLAGMRDQTHDSFELIIVDRRYEKRHAEVMALAKSYGLSNVIHVPEHRRNGKWITFCSAWNTGFALARGEFVILLQDYAYAPPGFIEAHVKNHEGTLRRYVVGPYLYTSVPDLITLREYDFSVQMPRGSHCTDWDLVLAGMVLPEMNVFKKGLFDPGWLADGTIKASEPPDQDPRKRSLGHPSDIEASWIHIKNESIRRASLWELGGLDERLERGKGPMDIDFGIRLLGSGHQIWWDPTMPECIAPNPRWICRSMPWGAMEKRVEGRWSYNDGLAYNEIRKNEIKAVSAEDKIKASKSKNPYAWDDLVARLEPWRDRASGLLTPQEADDETYWKGEIWPESP